MPLTPAGIAAIVAPALAGSGMLGTSVPQVALGIGNGVCLWTAALTVTTVDVGTLGSGVGALPCAIPPPLLIGGMLGGFASAGVAGPMAPLLANGVANGLATAFTSQGLIVTVHPTVGVGTGVCTFPGPSAVPFMISGFASAGLVGVSTVQIATGVGLGLDTGFAGFTVPTPIVGAPAPLSGGGTGTGKIV